MRINSKLTVGLSKEDKESFEQRYENAEKVLKQIAQVLQKEIERTYISEDSLNMDVSLPIELAKTLGRRQGLRDALKYLPEV